MSVVLIVVHPDRLEFKPRRPHVRAAVEPLRVAIDWSENHDTWKCVRIGRFHRMDNSPVPTRSAGLEFRPAEGNVAKEIHFRYLEVCDVAARGEVAGIRLASGDSHGGLFDVWLTSMDGGPAVARTRKDRPCKTETSPEQTNEIKRAR